MSGFKKVSAEFRYSNRSQGTAMPNKYCVIIQSECMATAYYYGYDVQNTQQTHKY